MAKRVFPHKIEEKAENIFREIVTDIDIMYRNLSGRDYGIDGIVELFDEGIPTGKIAFIQIKGTEKTIEPKKRTNKISCPNITKSNYEYTKQKRIPLILAYISTKKKMFYYKILNKVSGNKNRYKTVIEIDLEDFINEENILSFYNLINDYYGDNLDQI